ncbi:MAG: SIS domain-containing protein, partial [Alphaproteobacteria bacterium]|nr:SIS domain-containing protein [Alphaproteobacteria bacterium]
MTFPDEKRATVESYCQAYFERTARAAASIDLGRLAEAAALLEAAFGEARWLFACGNGGSAAIANHLLCDHVKGIRTDTGLRPRVVSLSANLELITAIANDIDYDDVFLYQLESLARPGDMLMTISASGDSENIVRAIEWARGNGVKSIALSGFGGGRSGRLADISLHVEGDNYGV